MIFIIIFIFLLLVAVLLLRNYELFNVRLEKATRVLGWPSLEYCRDFVDRPRTVVDATNQINVEGSYPVLQRPTPNAAMVSPRIWRLRSQLTVSLSSGRRNVALQSACSRDTPPDGTRNRLCCADLSMYCPAPGAGCGHRRSGRSRL